MLKNPNKLSVIIILALVLGGLWIGFTAMVAPATTNGNTPAPREGFTAPSFELISLEGETIRLEDLRSQPLIINFWTSWCGPCRAEMPALQKIYDQYQEQGFTILAINATSSDTRSSAINFVSQNNISLPVLFDPGGSVSKLYDINSFPTTFFVDHEGIIVRKVVGGPLAEALLAVMAEQMLEVVP